MDSERVYGHVALLPMSEAIGKRQLKDGKRFSNKGVFAHLVIAEFITKPGHEPDKVCIYTSVAKQSDFQPFLVLKAERLHTEERR